MSDLSDAALPLAADAIDLINVAHHGKHFTIARMARGIGHRQVDEEGLILLAHIAAGLAQQVADATGRSVHDVIADLRRRAAA